LGHTRAYEYSTDLQPHPWQHKILPKMDDRNCAGALL
jgi:hypothetical protein